MIKLIEPEILLKVRREDLALIKSLVEECEREYSEIMARETTEGDYKTTLKVVETEFMTAEEGGECGGIILYSKDRRIVCPNTLKNRLDLCFEELLPVVRKQLFPIKK
jgi:V-type H+-transporting ATPase subunit E